MESPAPFAAGAPQWADQIERLCALLETITYRVLEVEERLTALEERLELALAPGPAGQEEALTVQLEETARRVARMEAALGGLERGREAVRPQGGGGRRLQALVPPSQWPDPDGQSAVAEADPDPFYDEGEQAFMDERTA